MLVAVDIDGCADAYPREFQSIMSALRAAGHTVYVVTGSQGPTVTQADLDEKATYLSSLGLGESYDVLTVIGNPDGDIADKKVQYLQSVGAHALFDNSVPNLKAATKAGILALCPWGSKEK